MKMYRVIRIDKESGKRVEIKGDDYSPLELDYATGMCKEYNLYYILGEYRFEVVEIDEDV